MLRGREPSKRSKSPTGPREGACDGARSLKDVVVSYRRRRDRAVHEGVPEAKDVVQAPDSYLPVAVSPSQLDFYIDDEEGHTQVLTLYNVNDHPVHFMLMSNAPRRFSVTGRAGIITPHCYTEIVVSHCDLSEGNVGIKDNLRVIMRKQGSLLQGYRDVPATLWSTRGSSDEETEDEEDVSSDSTQLQTVAGQGQSKGWTASVQDSLVLFVALACVVVLMLPLEDAHDTSSHSLLAHLPLSHEYKLFAAYILGLMTTLIFRK
ncbi:motile sperm domain-containing protein 1-like [Dermacentor silvarum]|uniref:motile sperm domain-containing protein 1-like n=1 Tax=Dermacentor silvarum TaxID=543639 RepID=UPI002100AF1D|nr:motile sperm domain-containing protein 1-like [Dermacentor silvarum]